MIVYPTIASRTLVLFHCRSIVMNNEITQFLVADYRVVCNDGNSDYSAAQLLAWFTIVFYIVGFPLLLTLYELSRPFVLPSVTL